MCKTLKAYDQDQLQKPCGPVPMKRMWPLAQKMLHLREGEGREPDRAHDPSPCGGPCAQVAGPEFAEPALPPTFQVAFTGSLDLCSTHYLAQMKAQKMVFSEPGAVGMTTTGYFKPLILLRPKA